MRQVLSILNLSCCMKMIKAIFEETGIQLDDGEWIYET